MANGDNNECLINGVLYKCRTCFDPGRTIFPLTNEASKTKTWLDLLKDIAQLQTNDDELLPKTLCCKCSDKLKKSYDFIHQIQNVNEKYSQLLANNDISKQVDSFTDCLAESAIALPLEQYMTEVKLEEEMVMAYNHIDMSNNKLQEDEESLDNEDNDDPFTETFDEEIRATPEQSTENESAIETTEENTTKRKRLKQKGASINKAVKRTKKTKQPRSIETDTVRKADDSDAKEPIVCGKCTQAFFTIHAYQRHQQVEHSSEELNDEKNKCPICSKEFRNKFYVVDHIKVVHDKLRPFKCSHCTKSFASAASKRIHELSHTDNFPYSCEHCDRRFRLPSKLKIHSEIHTTKPELLCPICKRSQRSQEELEAHVKNHDDNRLQCPSCGHLFRKRSNLNDHYNAVHLKLRPYKCEVCDQGFGDRKSRRVHQRSHHKKDSSVFAKEKAGENTTKRNRGKKTKSSNKSEELFRTPVKRSKKPKQPKKPVKMSKTDEEKDKESINEDDDTKETIVCDKCSQTFPTIHTYQRHQQAEHSSESNDEKNKCPICSKEFRNSWYVVDHIKVVHDKLKPYKCSHCPKSFASAHSKRIHELTHTDNFPYACEFCDRRFRLSSKLKIHSEIHTTKPELLCPICKRSQKSQEELEVHVKNHDDNRLQCPSCGNLFRRNAQLKDHYNAVHLKLRPYKCEFCELGFGDRKTRRVHQRTHHKQEISIPKQPPPIEKTYISSNDCSSGAVNTFLFQKVSRRQPYPIDDLIVKINDKSFRCFLCKKTLTLLRNCRRHVENVHFRESKQIMKYCSTNNGSEKSLQHNKNGYIQNSKNINVFESRIYGKPTAWRLVKCKLCSISFKTCKELRQHLENHFDKDTLHNLKLTDDIVQHFFSNETNLENVKNSIVEDIRRKKWLKYYTVLNKYSYEVSISDTEIEELDEENEERKSKYKCSLCNQEFSFKFQVFQHLRDVHSKEKVPFKCGRCKLEFISTKMYKLHLQTHCRNEHKLLLCGRCPAKFVWPESIKNHICASNADDDINYQYDNDCEYQSVIKTMCCCLCDQTFKRMRHLRRHMFSHVDGKSGIDFQNCLYVKQFKSSEPVNLSLLEEQIKNDFNRRQISHFYQATDKFGNEIDISDSDSDSSVEEAEFLSVKKKYNCEICNETFERRHILLEHQRERHGGVSLPFTCEHCKQQYVSMHLLQRHMKRECCNENRRKAAQCEFCSARFIWPNNLLKHIQIQHHIIVEPNQGISSTFTNTTITHESLSTNEETRTNMSDFTTEGEEAALESLPDDRVCKQPTLDTKTKNICSFCSVSFAERDSLITHTLKQHVPNTIFKCSVCTKEFNCMSDLQSHRLANACENPFACLFCDESYSRQVELNTHIRVHMRGGYYKCTTCQKSFKKACDLKIHFRSHSSERPFKCNICEKTFSCSDYLKMHQKTMGHTDSWLATLENTSVSNVSEIPTTSTCNKILCPICGTYLSKNTSLSLHMRTHSDDKPHKCEFCGRGFVRKTGLVQHTRTHTNERPFQCSHCGKAFAIKMRLTNHFRIHTGERPYQCKFCKKTFNVSSRLSLHLRIHTGEKPFTCEICGKAFICGAYLKKHRISKGHHKKKIIPKRNSASLN